MLSLLFKHAKLIFIWGVVFALAVGGLSLLVPHAYSADSQILIISRDKSGLDPFSQTKLAERIGENLSGIVQTEDFFNKVMEQAGTSFDKSRWTNLDERTLRKYWQRDVQGQMVYGTSLLRITVYGPTKAEAENLSGAVTQTLVSRAWEYIGGDVSLKVVNSPLVSRFIARPNLPVNTAVGFVLGMCLAAMWVVRYKRHTFLNN